MATPFYQPVLAANAAQPHDWLVLVLDLCKAIEAEDGGKIVLLTPRVVKTVNPRVAPIEDLPAEVFREAMARLLLIGEHHEFELLLDWYERVTFHTLSHREQITESWIGIFEFVTLPPARLSETNRDRELKRVIGALRVVLAAHAEEIPPPSTYSPPLPGEVPEGSFGSFTTLPRRIVVLEDGIRRLVASWMVVHQQFLDLALEQLARGSSDRGTGLMNLSDRWRAALKMTVDRDPYRKSKRLAELQIDLAKIQYGRSPRHRYLDFFPPYDARQFGFTPYDREPLAQPRGKTAWLIDLIRIRTSQLRFLLDEFGVLYDESDEPPRTDAERKAAMDRARRFEARRKLVDRVVSRVRELRLGTEDGLVDVLCAFFAVLLSVVPRAPTPDDRLQVWETLLKFLDRHLKLQTAHTEFNLDEEPSYFDRQFPRAIAGGALHDCGVYAVLLAFVFLSLADFVTPKPSAGKPPKVSFIMLPLHVGLIVEIDGFPPIIIHNNALFRVTADELSQFRKEWDSSSDARGDPNDPAQRDRKFLEDLAAQMFVRDVDLPLRSVPVAPVSAPPKKAEIWKAFRAQVVPNIDQLFSRLVADSGRKEYQFDLRFLAVLTLERRWFDATVVPFWNVRCRELWNRAVASSIAALERNAGARQMYGDALQKLLDAVEESYDKEIRPAKDELTKEFRAAAGLLGPKAQRITRASRLQHAATALGPVGQVRTHLTHVRKAPPEKIPVPDFALDAFVLTRFGD